MAYFLARSSSIATAGSNHLAARPIIELGKRGCDLAAALGRDDIGALAPGMAADIVLVDLGHPLMQPARDPLRSFVFHAADRAVRTVLVDGSVQYGDLRGLLKVPPDAPSILDLPIDRVAQSDLQETLWRDPSGIDILLAPPRIEQAEMLTTRDVEKVLSILRRVYPMVVVDTGVAIDDLNLVFLDNATTILEIATYDSMALRNLAHAT